MIPYEQARKLVIEKAAVLGQEAVTLDEALGRVAARDIRSKINVPPFRNSAMDGYAIRSEDTKRDTGKGGANYISLKLVAAQPAGDYFRKKIRSRETLKVMTGAPVPAGAEAVVPLEEVERQGSQILIKRQIKPGENIREAGEDVKKGEIIIRQGSVLKTPELGLLAACGFNQVSVYRRPAVAVIITGNELCEPGERLQPGKIYNSNAVILKALLKSSGVELVSLEKVEDSLKFLISALKRAVKKADLIITTGGVSVGDYDLVKEALEKISARKIFWQVAQKPAKPLAFYFLRQGQKPRWFFGLPGNPGAVMIAFEEYVRPLIKKVSGHENFWPVEIEASLTGPVKKKAGRLNFLRVNLENKNGEWLATPLGKQESGMMTSFRMTGGLALIPAEVDLLPAGTKVKVHLVEW